MSDDPIRPPIDFDAYRFEAVQLRRQAIRVFWCRVTAAMRRHLRVAPRSTPLSPARTRPGETACHC